MNSLRVPTFAMFLFLMLTGGALLAAQDGGAGAAAGTPPPAEAAAGTEAGTAVAADAGEARPAGVGLVVTMPQVPSSMVIDAGFALQLHQSIMDALTDLPEGQLLSTIDGTMPEFKGIDEAISATDPAGSWKKAMEAGTWAGALESRAQPRFLVLSRFVALRGELVTFRGWIFDLATGRSLAEATWTAPLDISFPVHAASFSQALIGDFIALEPAQLAEPPTRDGRQVPPRLVFRSGIEGMVVKDASGREFGTITNGKLGPVDAGVQKGKDLVLVLSCPGHYDATRSYRVERDGQEIDLGGLTPIASGHMGLVWHANYPVAASYRQDFFLTPDWQYWSVNGDLMVSAFPTWSAKEGKEVMNLILYPGLGIDLGTYVLMGPDSLVRMTLATRLGMVVGMPLMLDTRPSTDLYYVPFSLGLELNLGWFLIRQETYWKWYLGMLPNRLFPGGYVSGFPRLDLLLSLKQGVQP